MYRRTPQVLVLVKQLEIRARRNPRIYLTQNVGQRRQVSNYQNNLNHENTEDVETYQNSLNHHYTGNFGTYQNSSYSGNVGTYQTNSNPHYTGNAGTYQNRSNPHYTENVGTYQNSSNHHYAGNVGTYQNSSSVYQPNPISGQYQSANSLGQYQQNFDIHPNSNDIQTSTVASETAEASESSGSIEELDNL